ncbi:MAG: N-acetylmuramoyl-L-alanine amidase [Gammaproteobacteria bacterium]|nr:N-acetylmuramoyl-L-alanine amidase [Gammaproteobacteria bacterium]
MEIVEDKLSGVTYIQTPNVSKSRVITPELIVIHFTAGSSADSSIKHMTREGSNASAHIVISQQGEVTQLAGFKQRAWHAGKSQWHGRDDVNSFSIGIELDNPGRLEKTGNKYRSWFGKDDYQQDEVLHAKHKNESASSYWYIYPTEQLAACQEVCESLIRHYAIKDVVGHEDIAPGRKSDPGPAFPMENFRSALFGRDLDSEPDTAIERGVVSADLLNIRESPNGAMAGAPLTKGTELEVLEREGDWVKVNVVRKGWVSAHYIDS